MRKTFLKLLCFLLFALSAKAQNTNSPNEGLVLTSTSPGAYVINFFGRLGRNYFIQQSNDLNGWTYFSSIVSGSSIPIMETGSNQIIQWGFTSSGAKTFVRLQFDMDQNGLPDAWETGFFGQTGQNPNAYAPVENGLTILQCFQQGIDPIHPPTANYTISLSGLVTGNIITLTANVGNATSPIQNVAFFQGDSFLSTVTTSPFTYQYNTNTMMPGNYPVKIISLDSLGAIATANSNIQFTLPAIINQNWWYMYDIGNTSTQFESCVIPVDYTNGIIPFSTGTACPDQSALLNNISSAPFIKFQSESLGSPTSNWPSGIPWFLRIASSGTAYHISGTNASGPIYSGSLAVVNPLVAFGSQAGGTPLYTNQTYSFGMYSGGQNLNPLQSGTIQDFKIDVYSQSSFTGTATNVQPIPTTGTSIHLPRPGEPAWTTFAQNGYQIPITITTGSAVFNISIQYATSGFIYLSSGVNYPLLVSVTSNSAAYSLRFSVKGAIKDANNNWDWMAVDNIASPSTTGDYSLSFTTDFTQSQLQSWQTTILNTPSFAGTTSLPVAYQGMSEQDLLNLNPVISGSDSLTALTTTGSATYLQTGTNISTVTSPELVANPILDNFVTAMGNDPMALANYVQNEIGLVDAIALSNTGGSIGYTDQSINFGGVNRSALGVLLEGQGSPVEQCGLLVYLLRKAGVPCGYVFGPLDQTQMFSDQLSKMLRMQLNGAQDLGVVQYANGPTLIPVNYPWVAAYINGQWVHLFPWIKDTVVQEGYNLYECMPSWCKTGAEWTRLYLYNDSRVRPTAGAENFDNPGVLFPKFVQNYLPSNSGTTTMSLSDIGVTVYNRPHYYSSWNQFPHPWSRSGVTQSNLFTDLMSYSYSAFGSDNLFDTVSVQVFSDRAKTGTYVSGADPMIQSGTLYSALLNDRRFLLYHTPYGSFPNTGGTSAWSNYNMNLSLEAISSIATGTNIVSGTTPFSSAGDPFLLNKQFASAVITGTQDNNLYMVINYTRHRAKTSGTGTPFLYINDDSPTTDTRPLSQGDTAALCFNFGQVTHWMLEVQEEKFWNMQQTLLSGSSTSVDLELAQGLPAYLMGMTYYYREGAFINQYQALTKMQLVSCVAHGLAKLSPAKISGIATLINGNLNLRYPNVDMSHLQAVWVGNASIQPGSGNPSSVAFANYYPVFIAASSAQEHLTIQQFFASENDDAISTIKLMDQARGLTLTGTTYQAPTSSGTETVIVSNSGITVKSGTVTLCVSGTGGMIELNSTNYEAIGQLMLTGTQNGNRLVLPLSVWAGGLWSSVTAALSGTNSDSAFHTVFITPGPISGAISTTGSGSQAAYYGMGALIYGTYDAAALITPNYNGGFGSDFGLSMPSLPIDIINTTINDGFFSGDSAGATMTLGSVSFANTSTSTIYVSSNSPLGTFAANAGSIESSASNGTSVAADQVTLGTFVNTYSLLGTTPIAATTGTGMVFNLQINANVSPLQPDIVNWNQAVSDPVNAVTGEFYVDEVDLKLNGPMPLEIRRNYTSQNPFSGAFGYGWKISMVPYLVLSQDTNQTLIYAAEKDGSVITYRRQASPNTRWIVTGTDNPQYTNPSTDHPGSPGNLLNNHIDESVGTSGTTFTLTGADGSVRTFLVESFITSGTNGTGLTRTRPYLQKWQDNRGNYFTFSYGPDPTQVNYGQLTRIQSSNGNYAGFMYDTYGHVTQAFTGDGSWAAYQYDNYGDLIQVTLTDASVIQYSYRHQLQSNTTNQYYSEHLLTEEDKPGGRILQNLYDNFGFRRVVSQKSTVQQGNSAPIQNAKFNYNITGITSNTPIILSGTSYNSGTTLNLSGTTIGSAAGSNIASGSLNISAQGLLSGTMPLPAKALFSGSTTITDVNGNTTVYSYTNGQVIQISTPPQNNGTIRQTINQNWNLPTSGTTGGVYPCSLQSRSDKRGLVTSYTYDVQGNLASVTLSGSLTGLSGTQSATTTMTYNNSVPVTLPGSGLTAIPNTLASGTDAIGNSVNYTYSDSAHPYLPTSILKSASGSPVSTTILQYQNVGTACGLLQQETIAASSSDQSITVYTNNSNGFPTTKKQFTGTNDPNISTTYIYDLRGELTSVTDAAGRNTTYSYDARGNQVGVLRYDESGNLVSWQFSYYNQNGEIEWTQGPRYAPDDTVQKEYDRAGHLCMVNKSLIAASYDGSEVVSNGSAITFYSYDNFGNLTQILDPNQNTTTMYYDAIGEMISRQTPNGSYPANESFTYEPGGKVATHTTVLGGVETNSYTSTGLLISGTKADGSSKSYQYDLSGRVLKETINNSSYWLTTYDDLNRTVKRNFYSATGTPLTPQPEIQSFDRRGNLISKTDLAGNQFKTTYDGLNRVKQSTGPAGSTPSGLGSTAQQYAYHTYDSAGLTETVTNALNEQKVITFDALQRPTSAIVYNLNGSISSKTSYVYSPNNQSVTTIEGSGTNGVSVSNTLYTDTFGNPVLLRHADGSFQATAYDANENKVLFQDELSAQTLWTYDALNHPVTEILPASSGVGAKTIFQYNAAGELLTRQMPGNLTGTSGYNIAGQKVSEALIGSSGSATRQYGYSYYSGSNAGLLQTGTDPRGFTVTTVYDAWLRPYTVNSSGAAIAQQNQNTTYGYDIRGMVNSIAQSYVSGSAGPSTLVTRSYDSYGKINQETVYLGGTAVSQWNQSWDGAGRRLALNYQLSTLNYGVGSQYGYLYNADGEMTQVANSGVNYLFSYGDNKLLNQRVSYWRTQTITARDNMGQITAENIVSSGVTRLSETMSYRLDSRMDTYNRSGSIVTSGSESRVYGYDKRGRLVTEPFILNTTPNNSYFPLGSNKATYQYDGNVENGLGVRTSQFINSYTGDIVMNKDNFQRPTQDTTYIGTGSTNPWALSYDAAGSGTNRTITTGSSVFNVQTLTWDAWGRLVMVSQRNTGTSDFDSKTVYDGLGRRVQTTWQPMNNGAVSGSASPITYYYDPQVEFLELGINNNGDRKWKVYGPDRSGRYGGAQGIGGLESIIDENQVFVDVPLNNYFGDAVGEIFAGPGVTATYDVYGNPVNYYYVSGGYTLTYGYWWLTLGGNGPVPGTVLEGLIPEWRGHYMDWTGFINMGARYYDPQTGRFLCPDPYGHAASMDLYSYCNGDPINGIDPTGRCPVQNQKQGVHDSPIQLSQELINTIGYGLDPGALERDQQYAFAAERKRALATGELGPQVFYAAGDVAEGVAPIIVMTLVGELVGPEILLLAEEEGATAAGVTTSTENVINGVRLNEQLRLQSAASPFAADGTLTESTITNSREIIPAADIENKYVPSGMSKYSTPTYQSPSGDFQVHFYKNPTTGEVYFGLDYKVIFKKKF